MKVLIAEDNRLNRLTLVTFLKDLDAQILIAEDGLQALSLWETETPEIVITDLSMPKLNGFELLTKIREREQAKYTYIIVLTVDDTIETLEKSYEAGADDFLIKPFNRSELKHRIAAAERIIGLLSQQLVIYALAQLSEMRDVETGEHIERIGTYSRILAKSLKTDPRYSYRITGQFIDDIALSSALHDIGKVGVDDKILRKPSALDAEEWTKMKQHTLFGSQVIESIGSKYPQVKFLKMAAEIAKWHHERFDGSGYPDGLSGEEIPLAARIVAVADVYDALVSERVYKQRFTHEKAYGIIVAESGTQFDPGIVEAFRRSEQAFIDAGKSLYKK
jgi:putative two-component system response regulator